MKAHHSGGSLAGPVQGPNTVFPALGAINACAWLIGGLPADGDYLAAAGVRWAINSSSSARNRGKIES
jgi:hypothetical protein